MIRKDGQLYYPASRNPEGRWVSEELSGSIENMFDFQHARKTDLLLLKPKTVEVKSDDKD
jgi:hypothetical protein